MKLILAIVNNDDSAKVCGALTNGGYFITKLSTTGGFLMVGNTTILIGAEDTQVDAIKKIISDNSSTRKKEMPSVASFGRGLGAADTSASANVTGATMFVLVVESFEKL